MRVLDFAIANVQRYQNDMGGSSRYTLLSAQTTCVHTVIPDRRTYQRQVAYPFEQYYYRFCISPSHWPLGAKAKDTTYLFCPDNGISMNSDMG